MKRTPLSKQIFLFAFFVVHSTFAVANNYTYFDLQMKNFEEMRDRVQARLKNAEKAATESTPAAQVILKDALRLILSRPNSDNMASKLVPSVKTLLKNLEIYDPTLTELAKETLQIAKNESGKPEARATALIALVNFMSEFKPEMNNNPVIKKIVEQIRDAEIEISDDVRAHMHLRSMLPPPSPSETAKLLLEKKK